MTAYALLDALLVATIASAVLIAAALRVGRSTRVSGQVRHQLLVHAALSGLAILAITATVAPGPIGCLTGSCSLDRERADRSARVQQYHTAAAAGKFADLAPATGHADPAESFAGGEARPRAATVLLAVWLAGVAMALFRVGRRRWWVRRFLKSARSVEDPVLAARVRELAGTRRTSRSIRCLEHPGLEVPVVAGSFRPALVLPAGTTACPEVDMALLHELGHVKRRDPLVTLLAELAGAVFWFNPLLRPATRRIAELQELAADSHVLRDGIRPSRYAEYLVDTFRELSARRSGALHMHSIMGGCLMEDRVRALLDSSTSHRVPTRTLTATITALFAIVSAGLSFAPAALQASGVLTQDAPRSQDLEESRLNPASLDSLLRPIFIDHMADRYIAGAAIAVVHDGELVYRGGFGRREVFYEAPVEPGRTIWRIGSITKVLTGVAVMQLVDRGLVDLDADVQDYLPELEIPDTYDEPVRVRHLLTHTAGFDQVGLGRHASSPDELRPLGEFLEEHLSRIRPPAVVSTYDTYGITLAGYLVEQVTGLSYEEYLRRHIFEPLEMHRSGIAVPPALADDVAVGYGFAGHWEAEPWEFMNTDPASTVNATVVDMANFAIMMLDEGRFADRRVLSETSARAMLTPQWRNDPDQPGYGYTFWEDRSYGIPAFSHGGSMTGYSSFLYLVPEHELGVFIAFNQESGSLHAAVLSGLLDALFPGRRESPDLRPSWEGPPEISRFTGTWANSLHHHGDPETGWRRQPVELRADDEGRLIFQGAPAMRVGPLAFQREDGLLITFQEDARGDIEFMFVNQAVYEKLD